MPYTDDGIEPFNTPFLSCSFVMSPRGSGVSETGVDIGGVGALAWVATTRCVPNFLKQAESVAKHIVSIDGSDASNWSVSRV